MPENLIEQQIPNPLLKELGISHIGTLVLLGQGPIQDSATKVKLAELYHKLPTYENTEPEGNMWLRMIARAGATLWKTGGVDQIVASGGARGNESIAAGRTIPAESDIMEILIKNLTRQYEGHPEIQKDLARNTIWNMINAANTIDAHPVGDTWFVCAHYHVPRIRVLASILGFNPDHVVSAEEVIAASEKRQIGGFRGHDFQPDGFDRRLSMLELIKARLDPDNRKYFDKKNKIARKNLRKVRGKVRKKLFIEERQSAADRMKLERRWVRGIAMAHQYVAPLLNELQNPARRARALSHFPQGAGDAQWRYDVVPQEWENETYPDDVKERLQTLGLSSDDIERLSQARVPDITFVGSSV